MVQWMSGKITSVSFVSWIFRCVISSDIFVSNHTCSCGDSHVAWNGQMICSNTGCLEEIRPDWPIDTFPGGEGDCLVLTNHSAALNWQVFFSFADLHCLVQLAFTEGRNTDRKHRGGFSQRSQTHVTAGGHIRGTTTQTRQRKNEIPQNSEC